MNFFRFFKKYLPGRAFRNQETLPPDPLDDDQSGIPREQRGFSRHWVSFPVIVSTGDDFQNGADCEKAVLKDISGGGALFVSSSPENYYPGQLLKISIMLDGTNDVKARIKTEATVIRIHYEEKAGMQAPERPAAGIAVQFDRSFEFERIDNHDFGSIG